MAELRVRLDALADAVDRRLVETENPHERVACIALMMDMRDGATAARDLGELLSLIEGRLPKGVDTELAEKAREIRVRFEEASSPREARP